MPNVSFQCVGCLLTSDEEPSVTMRRDGRARCNDCHAKVQAQTAANTPALLKCIDCPQYGVTVSMCEDQRPRCGLCELRHIGFPKRVAAITTASPTPTTYTPAELAAIPPAVNAAARKNEKKYARNQKLPDYWRAMMETRIPPRDRFELWQTAMARLDRPSLHALSAAAHALGSIEGGSTSVVDWMEPHRRGRLGLLSLAFYPAIVQLMTEGQ